MDISFVLELIKKYKMPENIVRHCKKVSNVACEIAILLQRKGMSIDIESLKYAGLLHDLMRILDFKEEEYLELCKTGSKEEIMIWDGMRAKYIGKKHTEAGYEFFHEIGEEKIALMIRKHCYGAIVNPSMQPFTIEEKLLLYADKRVLHDKIVSLTQRFEDGIKRHNPNKENLDLEMAIRKASYSLEKEIFDQLDINPEDIKG
ncbi:HDIG domain-containing protein [Patescibacteria group bacterium]|nr:HDIG domain-containing protein [Patescibacteria group bacterium]